MNPIETDYQSESNDKQVHHRLSNSSLRSLVSRYLQRNSRHSSPPQTPSKPLSTQRLARQTTTATFTGQRRCTNEYQEHPRIKPEHDDEQLIRARLSTRTSSLPAARCITYYYYSQGHVPTHLKFYEEPPVQASSRLNSITNERSRSQSHSSSQGNAGLVTTDVSDHSSSFENNLDEEHRRLHRRQQPSVLSTSYHSSRYSQRAVAQFMHERNKARLRRNQKASRMLGRLQKVFSLSSSLIFFFCFQGLLLAVFLVCWLPFVISYPTMILFPQKFPRQLESVVFWLGYANSLLNPFLYVYSSRNYRQAIFETLCCYVRIRTRQQLRYRWSLRK